MEKMSGDEVNLYTFKFGILNVCCFENNKKDELGSFLYT